MLGVVAPPGLQEYVAWPVVYNWVISAWVKARFQMPMSSSLPLKNLPNPGVSRPIFKGTVEFCKLKIAETVLFNMPSM